MPGPAAQDAPFRLPSVEIVPRPARPLREPLPGGSDMARLGLALRAETPDDLRFLHAVYADTRAAEMMMLGDSWDVASKRDFVDKQFAYQYLHHSRHFADGDYAIIEIGGRPAGRFYLHWGSGTKRDCRLFEFQLLPPFRGRGIGSVLLGALLRHARTLRYSVSLHVERMSPARRLYARFGFQPVGHSHDSASLLMQWRDGPVVPGLRLAE